MRTRPLILMMAACGALTGCEHRDRLADPDTTASAPAPVAESRERAAYLSVSNLVPRVGDTVIVAGTLGVGSTISLASFRVRLEFDTTRLAFLGEVPLPGMLRVTNRKGDAVTITGASSEASVDGRLFTLRFRVLGAAGLESLLLKIDEMNDANFGSTMHNVKRSSRLVLDNELPRGKGQSR